MARKKIREYDSKRLLKEHLKRLTGLQVDIKSAQVTESTDFNELADREPWLSSSRLVVKPDMLFGKRGKSGLVALNLDLAQVIAFVKERLGKEVEMGGAKAPITTFIVEPFVPHDDEFYMSIVSERLGSTISFSECGGIEIEENWDKVKSVFIPTEKSLTAELCAPLIATLPLEIRGKIETFTKGVFNLFLDLDFTFLEMNPFTLVNGEPYPLDMRGELDDTAAFKNFKKWGGIEFPLPFGRVMSPSESAVHSMDEKTSSSLKFTILNPKGRIWTMVAGGGASVIYADTVGDLGFANELGNYAEYSGAPNEDEVLQYARVLIDCATADPDGRKRALVIGGGIANFTDVSATFSGIIRALREKESKLKASRMQVYVRRGGPNYQNGLAKMRALGEEIGVPFQVYGPEASMTGICGCPPRIPLSEADMQVELDRRRPGQSRITTPRKETDTCRILSGLSEGQTTGTPIAVLVPNTDQRGNDYSEMSLAYRPSHADATYDFKYGVRSVQGGGRSSARETIGRVAAGAVAKKILELKAGTEVLAYVSQVHKEVLPDGVVDHDTLTLAKIESNIVRCPDPVYAEKMIAAIDDVRTKGDSVGGVVTCIVRNVPRGLGSPVFDKLEAELAKALMSLPATKGFEIGSGFAGTLITGSEHNDEFYMDERGDIRTRTNRSGGIQGGISNGEMIKLRLAFKPTSTITRKQMTVTRNREETELQARGRHDPCVVPRAVPMVEAMVALVLVDHLMQQYAQCELFPMGSLQDSLDQQNAKAVEMLSK